MLRFEILDPEQSIRRVVELKTFPIRIGKLTTSELWIDDPSVSRMHARIEKNADVYRLVDLGSAYGTFANQQKLMTRKLEDGDVLTFGKVEVRLRIADDMAVVAPSFAAKTSQMAGPIVPKLPSIPTHQTRPSVGGFLGSQKPKTLQKKQVSYERRFLSQRAKGKNGILELAQIWRGDVIAVDQYKAKPGTCISMGVSPKCNYRLDDRRVGNELVFLHCKDNGHWELLFNQSMDGFVLVDPKKHGVDRIPFNLASDAAFGLPTLAGIVEPGTKAIEISGATRAKFVFGEVTILVHFTDVVPLPLALPSFFSMAKWQSFGGLAASLLIHFSIFSMLLFATSRVDALMVDRILTNSRFDAAILQPLQIDVPEVDKPDEVAPPEELVDSDDVGDVSDLPFVRSASSGSVLTSSESVAVARQTGLLTQANVMNSMLAAGMNSPNLDALDWDRFDASIAATNGGYGLDMVGSGGGGPKMGVFGGNYLPANNPNGNPIRTAAHNVNPIVGPKKEAQPIMRTPGIDVIGTLDKRVIQRIVRQHSNELRACYEREVAKIKGLNGKLDVTWIIAVNGSVASVYLKSSTLKNKNVEDCVTNSIKYWRFPALRSGSMVQVNHPFIFELGSK